MILSIVLSLLGLGLLIGLIFTLAVHALPFAVALTVGLHVHDTGGVIGALVAGVLAGALTLLLGQIAFATVRSVPIRLAIAALYAVPAGIAGFHAVRGLAEITGANETWTAVFAGIGAVAVAGTAWARIASLAGPGGDDPAVSNDPVARHPIDRAGPSPDLRSRSRGPGWRRSMR